MKRIPFGSRKTINDNHLAISCHPIEVRCICPSKFLLLDDVELL